MCGGRATSHHHIWPQSKYPDLADEPANLLSLCAKCHMDHHSWAKRIPRSLVKHAEHLATTGSQERFLEKNYPGGAVRDA
jgi:5-methylcytosine-specific restriction endonuclease McrA